MPKIFQENFIALNKKEGWSRVAMAFRDFSFAVVITDRSEKDAVIETIERNEGTLSVIQKNVSRYLILFFFFFWGQTQLSNH